MLLLIALDRKKIKAERDTCETNAPPALPAPAHTRCRSPPCRTQQQHRPPSTPAWSSRAALSTPLVRSPPPLRPPPRWSHFHRRLLLSLRMQVSSAKAGTLYTTVYHAHGLGVLCLGPVHAIVQKNLMSGSVLAHDVTQQARQSASCALFASAVPRESCICTRRDASAARVT
jgi:hypothetical protein